MSCVLDGDLEPAVAEARRHMRRLEKSVYRGGDDNGKSVRAAVARISGVPESYLLRLRKRARGMTDVSGKYLLALQRAADRLDAAADSARARKQEADRERLSIIRGLAGGGDGRGDRGRAAADRARPRGAARDKT